MIATVLALPGLWAGVALAVACVAGSLWLRPIGRVSPQVSPKPRRHA